MGPFIVPAVIAVGGYAVGRGIEAGVKAIYNFYYEPAPEVPAEDAPATTTETSEEAPAEAAIPSATNNENASTEAVAQEITDLGRGLDELEAEFAALTAQVQVDRVIHDWFVAGGRLCTALKAKKLDEALLARDAYLRALTALQGELLPELTEERVNNDAEYMQRKFDAYVAEVRAGLYEGAQALANGGELIGDEYAQADALVAFYIKHALDREAEECRTLRGRLATVARGGTYAKAQAKVDETGNALMEALRTPWTLKTAQAMEAYRRACDTCNTVAPDTATADSLQVVQRIVELNYQQNVGERIAAHRQAFESYDERNTRLMYPTFLLEAVVVLREALEQDTKLAGLLPRTQELEQELGEFVVRVKERDALNDAHATYKAAVAAAVAREKTFGKKPTKLQRASLRESVTHIDNAEEAFHALGVEDLDTKARAQEVRERFANKYGK